MNVFLYLTDIPEPHGIRSVSYTHLDVYKRQTQGRTGTNLEILLLSGAPCFYVTGFYFQICQITTTTLQGTNGYIQTAEEFYGVGPVSYTHLLRAHFKLLS